MPDLQSRPYRPSQEYCCEACVFGKGEHAEWCENFDDIYDLICEAVSDAARKKLEFLPWLCCVEARQCGCGGKPGTPAACDCECHRVEC